MGSVYNMRVVLSLFSLSEDVLMALPQAFTAMKDLILGHQKASCYDILRDSWLSIAGCFVVFYMSDMIFSYCIAAFFSLSFICDLPLVKCLHTGM